MNDNGNMSSPLPYECEVNHFDKLVKDIRHRWLVCASDVGLNDFLERVLVHNIAVFVVKQADDAIGDITAN